MSSTEDLKNKENKPNKILAKPHWKTQTNHLGDLMSGVLEDVIAQKSGMNLDLIAAWEEIAGPSYAHCTKPEKINWPRQSGELDPFKPGTLTVACDESKAVFFQHEVGQIIERINSFFGFLAIEKIRIVQKPVHSVDKVRNKIPDKLEHEKEAKLGTVLDRIEDPILREKIAKFGRGVMNKSTKKSP